MNKKIAVITGSRAEYGYLKPLLTKIVENPNLELLLYVTGMHLVNEYGYTIKEIQKDGFEITRIIDMGIQANNTDYDIAISIANGIIGFSKTFNEAKPDIIVVFGDRIEPFAVAVVAVAMNIPIAHISGGEVGLGDIDDSIRHTITKLAHIHFTSSKMSKERVLKLGEESWRVFEVGALSLDTILNKHLLSKIELCNKYDLSDKSIILVCFHPITTEWDDADRQMRLVMNTVADVVNEEDMIVVVIYPNAYPGGYRIIDVIKSYMKKNKKIHVFENLPHAEYISFLAASKVFVGNSSSGIIEAPSLGVPYVCIGTRQEGRERAKNVIDVGYNKCEIKKAIRKALFDRDFLVVVKRCESPYGNGTASERVVKVLSKIEINKALLQKKMSY